MTLNHRDALSGALVADAASLGLHWLYEPRQITKLEACGNLLFREPDAAVYENQKAFFAQGDRKSGQLSHYGESARLVGQLAVNDNIHLVLAGVSSVTLTDQQNRWWPILSNKATT